ncbi:stage V sporulation protein S [Paenibacillus sp. IHB B 3084]|uniref:stage V sporulation protein S n=1 Tax=Paenibacillus sp. IHB B 3084 TaxID=867076 RepID=UPI00071EF8E5|nr:stage V sporulation protein S [Paenibacillus sp. IHB B 3084]ALP37955.1 stage V sporulation protein S [Paenibacillus sp. IHB B 3084]
MSFENVFKVSAKSKANSLAGAVASSIQENGKVELQAVGAAAVNQALKAVAIARGFVAPNGVNLICVPAFVDVVINGADRTALRLIVEPAK